MTAVERSQLQTEVKVRIIEQLQKFCHHQSCLYPSECPKLHEKCKIRLNLSTSTAWIAASLVRRSDNTCNKANIYRDLYTLVCVIAPHKSQYPKLYKLVSEACTWATE